MSSTKRDNPYHKEWRDVTRHYHAHELNFKDYAKALERSYTARDRLVTKYAWAIPDAEAIKTIQSYGPIIEIGAGKGYWASLIQDIVCFDYKIKCPHFTDGGELYFPVAVGSFEKIKDFPDHTLLLIWPPYNKTMAYDCIKAYTKDTFILVGESQGGCTGDSKFWDEIEKSWKLHDSQYIPNWNGMNDYLQVYKRVS